MWAYGVLGAFKLLISCFMNHNFWKLNTHNEYFVGVPSRYSIFIELKLLRIWKKVIIHFKRYLSKNILQSLSNLFKSTSREVRDPSKQ